MNYVKVWGGPLQINTGLKELPWKDKKNHPEKKSLNLTRMKDFA